MGQISLVTPSAAFSSLVEKLASALDTRIRSVQSVPNPYDYLRPSLDFLRTNRAWNHENLKQLFIVSLDFPSFADALWDELSVALGDKISDFGCTDALISRASELASPALVKKILDTGADADEVVHNLTPLIYAIKRRDNATEEVLHLLFDHGADPNWEGPDGATALSEAIMHENLPAARILIQHGADPRAGKGLAYKLAQRFAKSGNGEFFDLFDSIPSQKDPETPAPDPAPTSPKAEPLLPPTSKESEPESPIPPHPPPPIDASLGKRRVVQLRIEELTRTIEDSEKTCARLRDSMTENLRLLNVETKKLAAIDPRYHPDAPKDQAASPWPNLFVGGGSTALSAVAMAALFLVAPIGFVALPLLLPLGVFGAHYKRHQEHSDAAHHATNSIHRLRSTNENLQNQISTTENLLREAKQERTERIAELETLPTHTQALSKTNALPQQAVGIT